MKKIVLLPLFVIIIIVAIFFQPFFLHGKLPIPADTIVGLYNPFRDLYAKEYPRGIPYKNFLITDPVRQQYPWRWLAITMEKSGELPLWNPYTMAGTPLLATLQGGAFYPLNFLFFVLPFPIAWSTLIFLQPLLAGIFLYLYLDNLRLNRFASLFGAITYAFCGFNIAWLEWGTLGNVALWLPLLLLSIDKSNFYFNQDRSKIKDPAKDEARQGRQILKIQIKDKKYLFWCFIFVFSLTASFFAGHLQVFFYLLLFSLVYFFVRWLQFGRNRNTFYLFFLLFCLFIVLTVVQWAPSLAFIQQSARNVDQLDWHKTGWFIPWQHLIQFIAPDFFGNPTTLNYWGIWNYGEFIGYIGIFPLLMALFALFFRYDKKTLFFGSFFFLSLIFALPTPFAKIPYNLQLPFLSTAQPTRLLFLTDFSLVVLAAFGFDRYLQSPQKRKIVYPLLFFIIIFAVLWVVIFFGKQIIPSLSTENLITAKRNLYFPTIILFITTALLAINFIKNKNMQYILLIAFLLLTVFDLFRFAQKFTPFTNKNYLFPQTATVSYLQKQKGQFRIMATDSQILPPNFSAIYKLQSLDGYDPLYLLRYGELMAAIERNKPDIHAPFGFNRIITPHNTESRLIDLLGVQYVLSFSDLKASKFKKVFEEGKTKVYKNMQAFPRAFFVKEVEPVNNKNEAITTLFDKSLDLKDTAVVENWEDEKNRLFTDGTVNIKEYKENKVLIDTQNENDGFIVLMDTYYPTWHANICATDETNCTDTKIYITNYNFRGIVVPAGKHKIIFYDTLL